MTIGEKRTILSAALVLAKEIEGLENNLQTVRNTGGVKSPGEVNGGRASGAPVTANDIIIELEDKIHKRTDELNIEKQIVRRTIEKLPLEDKEQELLVERYIHCRKWANVALLMGWSAGERYARERETIILNKINL